MAVPATVPLTASAFYAGYRSDRVPDRLLQAQWDFLGAPMKELTSRAGKSFTRTGPAVAVSPISPSITPNMTHIHPTAIVEEGAKLGADCVIHAYALVTRHCELGDGVVVHPFAAVGGEPQDLGFKPEIRSGVRVGARSVIREHVTINRATKPDSFTEVGSDCFLMTGSHVAHDCHVGNHVVIANAVLMGGHVQIGDRAFLGGGAVIHQFCRVGQSVMIGGGARISRDVAPFCMASERNSVVGLNVVGLRRRGFKREVISEIKRAYHAVNLPVGNLRAVAAEALSAQRFTSAEARHFLEFFQSGKRGFVRPRRLGESTAEGESD